MVAWFSIKVITVVLAVASGLTAVCAAGGCVLAVSAQVFIGGLNLFLVHKTQSFCEQKISFSRLHRHSLSSIKLSEFGSAVSHVALFIHSLAYLGFDLFLYAVKMRV